MFCYNVFQHEKVFEPVRSGKFLIFFHEGIERFAIGCQKKFWLNVQPPSFLPCTVDGQAFSTYKVTNESRLNEIQ